MGVFIMFKIIIVEDDKEIREELKILLENSGHQVKLVTDFENVPQKIIDEQAHLVLLDINLPNKSGYEICSKIRTKSNIPIIFVTSRNNSMDELKGIMLGGDDYIEKPYNVPILLARIQNLLNRTYQKENKESIIEYKGIVLDILKSTIKYQEKEIELTKTELKTLYFLLQHKDIIVPRADIINYLWDNEVYADDNSLSVIITRIREKIKELGIDNFIETKRGQGYKL
jgi:two-component system response regulator protein BraR/BceR